MSDSALAPAKVDQKLLSDSDDSLYDAPQGHAQADVASDKPKQTQQESEQLLREFMTTGAWTNLFDADRKLKGLTNAEWLMMTPFIVKWHNSSNTKPLPRQTHAWTVQKLESFATKLITLFRPGMQPASLPKEKEKSPKKFKVGTLREDASGGSKKAVKRTAADMEELPEQAMTSRSKGAPVFFTIAKAFKGLPQFTITDQDGKLVSNNIVDYDSEFVDVIAENLAKHDVERKEEVKTHNELVIMTAACWALFLSGCDEQKKEAFIEQANKENGKKGAILLDHIDSLLWTYDGTSREALTTFARQYEATRERGRSAREAW